MDRRDFLKKAAATTVVSSMGARLSHAAADSIPYRVLGHTGERVSIIGLGGYHLGMGSDEEQASASSAPRSTAESIFSITAGTITAASAKSAWARRCAMAIVKRHSS